MMNTRELETVLAAADPVDRRQLDRVDLEAMEADLLADLDDERSTSEPLGSGPYLRRRPRALALALGTAVLAGIVVAVLILVGGASDRPSPAYGASLIRFAESTPLMLLEGPDWRVQNVTESRTRAGTEGQMEFVTGKSIPYGTEFITGNAETGEYVHGLPPAAERQRKVELEWRTESLAAAVSYRRGGIHPHGKHFVRLPVLGTTALVDTRAEIFVNQGGPGDREMVAVWGEDGNVLTMRAAVPGLAGMRERLDWLAKVDSQTWLEAMPAKVVAAADLESTYRRMLRGIPLPKTFGLSRIPDEGLPTNREQLAGKVTNTVACLWFRQWGAAQRSGDKAAELEAERALASSKNWPVLREENGSKPYTGQIYEFAMAMPQGYWDWRGHHRSLLAHAEGLACARYGLPLLPEKMKRQREHGVPPPPD